MRKKLLTLMALGMTVVMGSGCTDPSYLKGINGGNRQTQAQTENNNVNTEQNTVVVDEVETTEEVTEEETVYVPDLQVFENYNTADYPAPLYKLTYDANKVTVAQLDKWGAQVDYAGSTITLDSQAASIYTSKSPEECRTASIKTYSNKSYKNTKCTELTPINVNGYEGYMYVLETDSIGGAKVNHLTTYYAVIIIGEESYFAMSATKAVVNGGEDRFLELVEGTLHKVELK
ncbi:MAG: hypothetical protein IIW92_06890 [Lachnospiraceae bacterium]|nr:hypothetical protein [Lachnospiraceae bacterium]